MDNLTGTEHMTNDDAAWALTCAFLILTMQTGFAMLECGCVSTKNTANIMIKNVVDVSLGGISYWLFGYALSFGPPSSSFVGFGGFCFSVSESTGRMGSDYAHYFFQFSFATTATTIVSGAVAERMRLRSYMIFSFVNTFVYCLPAGWAWNAGAKAWNETAGFYGNTGGFLYRLKFFDLAGTCVVHVTGGTSALVAAYMLGPRMGRFDSPDAYKMNSPITAMTGMFMLWWAWLGFNCGSTFGVSGNLWKITALIAVTTLNGAIGGGVTGIVLSMACHRGKIMVDHVISSVLGGLVSITGAAAVIAPYEALLIGAVGGLIATTGPFLLHKLKIDDPVGAIPVHLLAGSWGTLAVGVFGQENLLGTLRGAQGLIKSGDPYLLGVQTAALVILILWSAITTIAMLLVIKKTCGLRMSQQDEVLGADWVEHQIRSEPLANRLEQVLLGLDEENWTEFIQKLYWELISKPTQPVAHGHRIFSVDPGRDTEMPREEAEREIRSILKDQAEASNPKPQEGHVQRQGTVGSLIKRRGINRTMSRPGLQMARFNRVKPAMDKMMLEPVSPTSSGNGTGSTTPGQY